MLLLLKGVIKMTRKDILRIVRGGKQWALKKR